MVKTGNETKEHTDDEAATAESQQIVEGTAPSESQREEVRNAVCEQHNKLSDKTNIPKMGGSKKKQREKVLQNLHRRLAEQSTGIIQSI